jgi:hypothetical protein
VLEKTVPNPKEAYEQGAALGSLYKCDLDTCNRVWVLRDSQREGIYWSTDYPVAPVKPPVYRTVNDPGKPPPI